MGERNSKRPETTKVPDNTIIEMSKKLEPPEKLERAFRCVDYSEFLSEEFLNVNVLPPHVELLHETEEVSEKEARDLVARSVVSDIMKEFPEMRQFGREVAKFKRYVLSEKE